MYDLIGVRRGKVEKEGKNKGKEYSILYIAFDAPNVDGKCVRDVFVFNDLIDSIRPLMPGDQINIYTDLSGRVSKVTL